MSDVQAPVAAPAKGNKYQGIVICGQVIMKEHKPAGTSKDGEAYTESWRVSVGWFGGNAQIRMSEEFYKTFSMGQDVRIPVMQKGFGNSVYNTAIEL